MKLRVFVQVSLAATILFELFGTIHHPVQAEAYSYVSFRALDKRTTLIDTLTMTSSDLTTIMAYSGTGLYDICAPLQGNRSDPSIGPDWLIQLTVVVIVMCASIGALGTRLTRARHRELAETDGIASDRTASLSETWKKFRVEWRSVRESP